MSLKDVAARLLQVNMGLKSGESLLVVTDPARAEIGRALYEAGVDLGADAVYMEMQPRQVSGQEPPAAVAAAMQQADVVIAPTTHSLTHTAARKAAVAAGARLATMPGITPDMFTEGAVNADYAQVAAETDRLAAVLTQTQVVEVVKAGYRLRFSVEGRAGISSSGLYRNRGESGNLPSGEAYLAPVEGTANGQILVDGSFVGLGRLPEALLLTLQDGRLVAAEGPGGERLLAMLDGASPQGRNLAEFGIGTNPAARLTGNILEDEKIASTIHVAFGSNNTFGGTVAAGIHLDGVVLQPDLFFDGVQVMEQGKLLI